MEGTFWLTTMMKLEFICLILRSYEVHISLLALHNFMKSMLPSLVPLNVIFDHQNGGHETDISNSVPGQERGLDCMYIYSVKFSWKMLGWLWRGGRVAHDPPNFHNPFHNNN